MRIAISGSHRTGKSTLLERLGEELSDYATVDEPYHLLAEEGYEFNDPPSVEDFVQQLERSLDELGAARDDVIFDRCPLDFLAYIDAVRGAEYVNWDEWIPRVRKTLKSLDFVVFVPIEEEDRISSTEGEDGEPDELRAEVDARLWESFLEDPYHLDVEYLEVEGDVDARVEAVLSRIR